MRLILATLVTAFLQVAHAQPAPQTTPRTAPKTSDAGKAEIAPSPKKATPTPEKPTASIKDTPPLRPTVDAASEPSMPDYARISAEASASQANAAWISLVLGAATIVASVAAWVTGVRAAKSSERAALVAEESAQHTKAIGEAQLRAYVLLENITPSPPTFGQKIEIAVHLKNCGTTPAKGLRVTGATRVLPLQEVSSGNLEPATGNNEIGMALASGGTTEISMTYREILTQPLWADLIAGLKVVVFELELTYQDVFGTMRVTKGRYRVDWKIAPNDPTKSDWVFNPVGTEEVS